MAIRGSFTSILFVQHFSFSTLLEIYFQSYWSIQAFSLPMRNSWRYPALKQIQWRGIGICVINVSWLLHHVAGTVIHAASAFLKEIITACLQVIALDTGITGIFWCFSSISSLALPTLCSTIRTTSGYSTAAFTSNGRQLSKWLCRC